MYFLGLQKMLLCCLTLFSVSPRFWRWANCSLERSHHHFRIELYAWNVPKFVIFFTTIRFQSFCMFIKQRQQTNCLNVGTNCKSSRRIFRLEQLWKRRYCNLCRLPPQALSIDSIPQAQEKHRWEPRAWEIHLALTYLHRNHATRLDFWIR